jgi:hypothetical protein
VATTLFISVEQVRLDNALAADYMLLPACVDRKDILLDLLDAPSYKEREDAMRVLSRYPLITRRPADSAFNLDPIVHDALRSWLPNQELLGQRVQCVITRLLRMFPNDDPSNTSKCRRLLPQAKSALSHSLTEQKGTGWLTLARMCASALHSDGRYNEAKELEMQVLEISERVFGDKHPQTLTSMESPALVFRSQDRKEEAVLLMERCVQLYKQTLGSHHPDFQSSLKTLTEWQI